MSRNYRLVDIIPPPKDRRNSDEWDKWCAQVSDKILDITPEIQSEDISSNALYSAVMTIIYKIPAGTYNIPIDDIMTRDIVNSAGKLLGTDTYKALQVFHYKWITCKNLLATKFREALKQKKIKASDWCKMAEIPNNDILPWLQFGAQTLRIIEINKWLQKNAPWPFSPESIFKK